MYSSSAVQSWWYCVRVSSPQPMCGRKCARSSTCDTPKQPSQLSDHGEKDLDLRTNVKHSTVGQAAPVADAYLEFQRRFAANEENPADFTHGVAQMLTMINHPRLLSGGKAIDEPLKKHADIQPPTMIERLYLRTLSRRPSDREMQEATRYVEQVEDRTQAYNGVLWMLVNRSEFMFVR